MMEQITVICVDDHLLIRQAVRSLLAERDDIVLVGEGGNGDAVLSLMAEHNPDILILDSLRKCVGSGLIRASLF